MTSLLSFTVSTFVIVFVAGQDNDLSSQQSQNSQINPSQGKQFEYNQPGGSTTVCVELRNGPMNPYAVCGPQVPTGSFQYPQGMYPNTKDSMKIQMPMRQSQINQQAISTDQRPVIQNGRLIQASPSNSIPVSPIVIQPMSSSLQPYYRSPASYPAMGASLPQLYSAMYPRSQLIYQTPSYLYQKSYSGVPSQQSSLISDGSLSMNCRVGGIKYSNNQEVLNSLQNNAGYHLPQPMYSSSSSQNSYRAQNLGNNAMWNSNPMWGADMNSLYSHLTDPFAEGRDATELNEMMSDGQLWKDNTNNELHVDTSKMVEENKKKLNELKQQIASLQDMQSQGIFGVRESPNEMQQNATQNHSQQSPHTQQPVHPVSPPNNEQKQTKSPNPQSQGHARPTYQRKPQQS